MKLINITNENWIDLIFENRNQNYGAYLLRKENNETLFKSFMIGCVLFIIPFIILLSIRNNKESIHNETFNEQILPPTLFDVDLVQIPPVQSQIQSSTKSKVNVIKYTEFVPVSANKITEEVVSVKDLFDGVIGNKNIEGDEDGTILVDENPGITDIIGSDTGNTITDNKVFDAVEIKAVPFGGLDKFYSDFAKKYNAPNLEEGVSMLNVIVRFVVEIDGSISNVTILRDPGMGAGKEAVRVLKTMPKWTPAVQNGTKVRSNFTLPIKIKV